MNLTVLRKTEYKGYIIYLMNYGKMFQYLFATKNGEIYQDHVFLRRTFTNIIKYLIGLSNFPYSKEEIDWVQEVVLSGAIKSIDALDEEKHSKKNISKKKDKDESGCTWRVIKNDKDENVYECLDHNVTVKMEEGIKPFHEK